MAILVVATVFALQRVFDAHPRRTTPAPTAAPDARRQRRSLEPDGQLAPTTHTRLPPPGRGPRPRTASTTTSRPREWSTPAPTMSRSLNSFRRYGTWLLRTIPTLRSPPHARRPAEPSQQLAQRSRRRFGPTGKREIELLGGSMHVTIISATPDAFSATSRRGHPGARDRRRPWPGDRAQLRYTAPTTYLMLVVLG